MAILVAGPESAAWGSGCCPSAESAVARVKKMTGSPADRAIRASAADTGFATNRIHAQLYISGHGVNAGEI
jgi:hypothetical protein